MATGITLEMRAIRPPTPRFVHISQRYDAKGRKVGAGVTYVNPMKDRSVSGKARKAARKAGRQVIAGFACTCGARVDLLAREANDREWFDGLSYLHAVCDGEA